MSAVLEKARADRAELRTRAEELYRRHYAIKAIARELGVAPTTIRRWVVPGYAEHLRRLSREAKQRRTGVCIHCGGETKLGRKVIAEVCGACAPAHYAPIYRDRVIGRGPITERARELLADGPKRRSYLRDELGISQDHMSVLLNRLVQQGYIERVEIGVYQLCSTAKSVPVSAADPSPNRRAEPSDA